MITLGAASAATVGGFPVVGLLSFLRDEWIASRCLTNVSGSLLQATPR